MNAGRQESHAYHPQLRDSCTGLSSTSSRPGAVGTTAGCERMTSIASTSWSHNNRQSLVRPSGAQASPSEPLIRTSAGRPRPARRPSDRRPGPQPAQHQFHRLRNARPHRYSARGEPPHADKAEHRAAPPYRPNDATSLPMARRKGDFGRWPPRSIGNCAWNPPVTSRRRRLATARDRHGQPARSRSAPRSARPGRRPHRPGQRVSSSEDASRISSSTRWSAGDARRQRQQLVVHGTIQRPPAPPTPAPWD